MREGETSGVLCASKTVLALCYYTECGDFEVLLKNVGWRRSDSKTFRRKLRQTNESLLRDFLSFAKHASRANARHLCEKWDCEIRLSLKYELDYKSPEIWRKLCEYHKFKGPFTAPCLSFLFLIFLKVYLVKGTFIHPSTYNRRQKLLRHF